MVVGAARHQAQPAIDKARAQGRGVLYHMPDIGLERRLQGLAEGDRLANDDMHERTSLRARENRLVNRTGELVVIREDEAAARPTQGLMARRGHHIREGHRRRMGACGDEARDVRHVDHEARAHAVRNGSHALEVDCARVGRRAAHDELRALGMGKTFKRVVIDGLGLGIEPIGEETVQPARKVDQRPMGEMSALVQAHANDRVTWLDERHVGGEVRTRPRVRLHVGVPAAKELACALACEILDHVDLLAPAVITATRIPLGVLVGEHAPHGLHNGR